MFAVAQEPFERLEGLFVADVMARRVAVIQADATMEESAALLRSRGVGGAPVVDPQGRCIGVLSAADFLRFETTSGHRPIHTAPEDNASGFWQLPWNSVQRFMSTPVHSVSPVAPMMRAAELMCTEHIHRLIVLDDQERPVGLVSTFDIVAALVSAVDEDRQHRGRLAARSTS